LAHAADRPQGMRDSNLNTHEEKVFWTNISLNSREKQWEWI